MKTLIGKVVSLKMVKTAVVGVETRRPHPFYKKIIRKTKKYKADTSGLTVKEQDKVEIVETRPLSKEKRWKIKKIYGSA